MIWCAQKVPGAPRTAVSILSDGARTIVAMLPVTGQTTMVLDVARERAAVVIDHRVWGVERIGPATELGGLDMDQTSWTRPVPAWMQGGRVGLVGTSCAGVFVLADGWSLEVGGDVEADGGFSGGHTFSTGPYEQRASIRARLTRGPISVVAGVPKETATTTLKWPPVVGPRGVLLRRARSFANDDGGTTTESIAPWLVEPSRALLELPVELGISPLAALPDGTWLLPGASALWRDDYDEPLHVMDERGSLTGYRPAGAQVRPSSVIEMLAPHWAATRAEREAKGDAVWLFEQARFDAGRNELRLLLTDVEMSAVHPQALRWLAVAIPHDRPGPARVLASGTHDDVARVAVSI